MSGCVPGKLRDHNTSQHLITAWCMQGTVVGTRETTYEPWEGSHCRCGHQVCWELSFTERFVRVRCWARWRLCPWAAPVTPSLSSQLYHRGNQVLQSLHSSLKGTPRGSDWDGFCLTHVWFFSFRGCPWTEHPQNSWRCVVNENYVLSNYWEEEVVGSDQLTQSS